jgi:hypothetical protein
LQFFGSSSERFKLFENNKQNQVGPGVYNHPALFEAQMIVREAIVDVFTSGIEKAIEGSILVEERQIPELCIEIRTRPRRI